MPKMRMLTPGGHEEVEWDVAEPETVTLAEALFTKATEAGYSILEKQGESFVPVETFDPTVKTEFVAVPQITGG